MDQVEEVKQKVDMVALVGEYVQLKKAGRNYKGLCPFHGEKSPSFMVNPELQIYKCFGCGKGGDCFSFLQDVEGMNFSESLQHLAKKVGITLERYKPNDQEVKRERLIGINTMAAEAYHWLLIKHEQGKTALKYIKGRGITDESIERYRLGFAPDDWHFLEGFLVKKKNYGVEELVSVGLLGKSERTGTFYDRFRERIMFPLSNNRGQVVGFAGRVLPGADEKAGGKYVNTSETELYHKSDLLYGLDLNRSDIKREEFAVVVEGEMDAIASWQAGVKNVVAIKGSALTERQVELLRRLCETVVLSLDADLAGDAAARRGIEIAQRAGLFVKVTKFADDTYKDPGEMAIAQPEMWKKTVVEAIPIYDFYLQSAVERYGLEAQGKKKIGQELMPVLAKIEDEIVRAHYINLLAQTLGVKEEDVRAQLRKLPNTNIPDGKSVTNTQSTTSQLPEKKTRREVVEEYLVGLALRGEKVRALVALAKQFPFESSFWGRVVEQLQGGAGIGELPSELKERTQDLLLVEDRAMDIEREWEKTVIELETLAIREQMEKYRGQEDKLSDIRTLSARLSELTKGK